MSRYSAIFRTLFTITVLTYISCGDRDNPFAQSDASVQLSGLSSCMGETTDLSSESRTDQLDVTVVNGKVRFTHSGARFNCCLDSISLQNFQEGNVIRIVETPYTSNPCRCECSFAVEGEVVNLPAGDYSLEVASSASAEHSLCTVDIRVE